MPTKDEREERDEIRLATARALWDELAARARGLHCPEHFVSPWRVVVSGDTPERLRLQVYGCCDRLGHAVGEMVRADPRVSGPS